MITKFLFSIFFRHSLDFEICAKNQFFQLITKKNSVIFLMEFFLYTRTEILQFSLVQGIKNTRYDGAQILESQHGKSENSTVT